MDNREYDSKHAKLINGIPTAKNQTGFTIDPKTGKAKRKKVKRNH